MSNPLSLARSSLIAGAALLAVCAVQPLSAQRDLYGLGGTSASDTRRQLIAESREKVGALLADYESAWGSHDLAALMRLYGESATLYPAEGGVLMGRDAVRDYFGKLLPAVEPLRTRIVEFKVGGDLAFATLQVSYAVRDGQAHRSVTGTDVVVLRKDWAGDWTIVTHFARQDGTTVAGGGGGGRTGAATDSVATQ